MSSAKEFVETIARFLVSDPEAVVVREIEGSSTTIYELSVAPDDMGRIIGKGGRVVNAMCTPCAPLAQERESGLRWRSYDSGSG